VLTNEILGVTEIEESAENDREKLIVDESVRTKLE
jgi:hypothetical protein